MKLSSMGIYTSSVCLFIVLFLQIPVGHAQIVNTIGPCDNAGNTHYTLLCNPSDDYISGKTASTSPEESAHGRPSVIQALRDDVAFLLRQPDFYTVIGGLWATPSLIEYESPDMYHKWNKSATADRWFEAGEQLGDATIPFAIALVSYSVGKCFDSPKTVSFASDLFRANVINGILTTSMKVGINRKRPDGAPYGFPSGHTSHAFTTAGVIRSHYGPWLGFLSGGIAAYIGVSRLQENKHYVSDVIGGAILGSYVAYKITHRDEDFRRVDIIPVFEERTYGAAFTLRF